MCTEAAVSALLSWSAENGVWIDPQLEFRQDSLEDGGVTKGICVFSREEYIAPSTTLVRIPRDMVLSVRTCSLKGIIPFAPYGLGAQLALALALYTELLRARFSRWHGYIQSLPDGIVDLPIFLGLGSAPDAGDARGADMGDGIEALLWLRGTEADVLRSRLSQNGLTLLEEIKEYFEGTVKSLLSKHHQVWKSSESPEPSLTGFYRAFSLVSSRSFLIDTFHGLSMVPIADAFNHVVNNHVHLASNYHVCPECGSLHQCPHDDEGNSNPPTNSEMEEDDDVLEMVSNAPISPLSEIYNTYGETLTNAELLNQYGFILDVNENDKICWSPQAVVEALLPNEGTAQRSLILRAAADSSINTELVIGSDLVYGEKSEDKMLCLNDEAKISTRFWILLVVVYIASTPSCNVSISDIKSDFLEMLLSIQLTLEALMLDDVTLPRDHTKEISILLGVGRSVIEICKARRLLIGKPGYEDVDLSTLLEHIPSNHCRTHTAIAAVLYERSIVDACCSQWAALLESLKPWQGNVSHHQVAE